MRLSKNGQFLLKLPLKNDKNGFLSTSWSPDELRTLSLKAINKKDEFKMNSRLTAESHDYMKQKDLWSDFFKNIMNKND